MKQCLFFTKRIPLFLFCFTLVYILVFSTVFSYFSYAENLPKNSISHYSPLKSYYKKALTQLKKDNPNTKASDLYDQAYLNGLKGFLADYMKKNVNSYGAIGLPIPKTSLDLDVRPGIGASSFMSAADSSTGRDRLVVFSNATSIDRLKHEVSREIFRWLASKNPKFSAVYPQNRWLLSMVSEVAPKYGAYRSDKSLGSGIRQDFFRSPLTFDPASEDVHKLQNAHFLRFIDRDADLFEFDAFWQSLSSSPEPDGLRSLETAISSASGNSLFYYYRRFIHYLIFSSGSPVVFPVSSSHSISARDPITNGLARVVPFSENVSGFQICPNIEGNYTADLWAIPIQLSSEKKKSRTLQIKCGFPLTDRTAIDIYRTKKNYRSARKVASISDGNMEARFSVQNGDKLYIFFSNGSIRTQSFPLTLSILSE